MTRWGKRIFALTLATLTAFIAGCTHESPMQAPSGAGHLSVTASATSPHLRGLELFSRTYQLMPSGPSTRTQTARLPLTRRVPPGWTVVVAFAETSHGPWNYLPAELTANRRTAVFAVTQHSLFAVVGEDLNGLLQFFKTEYLDDLSSRGAARAMPPACGGQSTARLGYTIESSAGPTVYWCFGLDASGDRILRIVNNRPYPLEIAHPGLAVAEEPVFGYAPSASLSYSLSGNLSILAPGAQIGYRVSLAPGRTAQAAAEIALDGFGQSLLTLQAGINALVSILTRFGAARAFMGIETMDDALGIGTCADAMLAGNPGAALVSCLSPEQMTGYFGSAGFLLAPLASAGGFADFFDGEFRSLRDVWNSHGNYQIVVHQAAGPVAPEPPVALSLCSPRETRPSSIQLGCGAVEVSGIRWSSWTTVGNINNAGGYSGSASGAGSLGWVGCTGGGGMHRYPVTLTLTQPKLSSSGWIWTDMVIRFTAGHPAGLSELRLSGLPDFKRNTCIFTEG
jgi:hypothetical protein